jgi:hypothetical protein
MVGVLAPELAKRSSWYLAAVKSPTSVEELITSILEGQAERLNI